MPMLQQGVHSGDTSKENYGTWRQTQPGFGCFALGHNPARLRRLKTPLSLVLAPTARENPLAV